VSQLNTAALKSLRVETSDDGQIAEVVLVGPGKGNAMGPDFWREMPEVFAALDADPAVRVVLVRGDGGSFCYGLDLAAMGATMGSAAGGVVDRTRFLDMITQMQHAIDAVEETRKPVIAAVHGWCIGGGVDLIAACDVRLASADATISVREVKVAIVADMGSLQRLPGIIGDAATRRLALTGEDIDAERARSLGLVSDVFADPATLLVEARALARTIADNPPLVVQGVKRVMNATRDLPRRDGLAHVALWNAAFIASEDLGEAIAAFGEKRPPRFTGR
jgi:enoyl-CoA hydratase